MLATNDAPQDSLVLPNLKQSLRLTRVSQKWGGFERRLSKLQRHRQKGSPSATLFLKLFEEYDFKRDWNDGFARLNRIAQQEPNTGTLKQVSEALTVLAMMYEDGIGIPKDESKTVELYKRASDMGNDVAQCSLGVIYSRGRVLEKVKILLPLYLCKIIEISIRDLFLFGRSLTFDPLGWVQGVWTVQKICDARQPCGVA